VQYEEQLAKLHADIKEDARALRISNQVICCPATPGRLLSQDKLLFMEWQRENLTLCEGHLWADISQTILCTCTIIMRPARN